MNESTDIKEEVYEFVNLTIRLLFDDRADVCAIILSGSMDTQPVMEFGEKMKGSVLVRKYDYIVDLSRVVYISSTGLGFLMFLASHKKQNVYLSSPPESIAKPFKVLGIQPMFKFYNNIEELSKEATILGAIIQQMKQKIEPQKDIHYDKRWLKVLRDYLGYTQIVEEAQKMAHYIRQAEQADSITLPSEEKYACVLYQFIEKVFRKVANFDKEEIDDATLEIIAKELMTNAVIHGYNCKKEGVVEANYKINAEKLEINVIDHGRGFPASPDQVFPSAGLELLKKIFDDLSISEAPKKEVQGLILGKGTMVKLIKHLIPKP